LFTPAMRTESVQRRGTFEPSLALRARSSSTSAGDFVPAHRFNEYSVQRSIEELAQPGTVMGLHPEGTRNKTDDPYHFLRARAGVGRIALASPHARIIPAFVLGMGNDLPKELVYNWMRPKDTRIDVLFGPEIDLGDLRMLPQSPATAQRASERMLDAIRVLADKHRALVGAPAPARAETVAP